MKKLMKVALVAMCIVFMGSFAKAQVKIGYINQNDLVTAMPELKTVQTQMQAYSKTFTDAIASQQSEFQKQANDYQAKRATMADATRIAKEGELGDMQKRIQDYQQTAQQQVEAKSAEYMKPILEKVHVAIEAVAKEKGYNYVLDSSQTALLVSPPGDDMMAAVKLKLGLK
jgi:outer membrane protein